MQAVSFDTCKLEPFTVGKGYRESTPSRTRRPDRRCLSRRVWRVGMSLAYRLLQVEQAIPYEDVGPNWRGQREAWSTQVQKSGASAKLLAKRLIQLLDALTPACINFFWNGRDGYVRVRKVCEPIANGTRADIYGHALKPVVAEMEELAVPPPPKAEQKLMGNGAPLSLDVGDTGPELEVGQKCGALDIRRVWCKASVVNTRTNEDGVQYRVHYEGWTSKWDEWIDKESGRVSRDVPATTGKKMCATRALPRSLSPPASPPPLPPSPLDGESASRTHILPARLCTSSSRTIGCPFAMPLP